MVQFLGQKDPLEKGKATHSSVLGFPGGSAGKEASCNAGDLGSIPGCGWSPEEGKGFPLQYSGLENSMDCIVHGVTESPTQLSNFHFHLQPLHQSFTFVTVHIPWTLTSTCFRISKTNIAFDNKTFLSHLYRYYFCFSK